MLRIFTALPLLLCGGASGQPSAPQVEFEVAWINPRVRRMAEARVPPGIRKEQVPEMWQQLLIDRFKLAAHREPRVVPKYELVPAKGGPKFKEAGEQSGVETSRSNGAARLGADGFPELTRPGMMGINGRMRLYQTNMTMQQLATNLSGFLRMPVAENTGLKGAYEIRLFWVAETADAALPAPFRSSWGCGWKPRAAQSISWWWILWRNYLATIKAGGGNYCATEIASPF
jgi:uncharacterized protein (TIGR03435 family)